MFIVRFLLVFFLAVEDVLMTPPSKSVPSNTSTPDSSEGEMDRFSSLNIDYTPVVRSVVSIRYKLNNK